MGQRAANPSCHGDIKANWHQEESVRVGQGLQAEGLAGGVRRLLLYTTSVCSWLSSPQPPPPPLPTSLPQPAMSSCGNREDRGTSVKEMGFIP